MASNQAKAPFSILTAHYLIPWAYGIRLTSIFFQNEALTCRTIT